MPAPRDFLFGPWRAVPVLGVTQILSWGSIFYTPVLIVPLIAAERGWSISFGMGGFSVGLLAAGLSAPYVGRSIDRFGGHVVMTVGSLIGALGLFLIVRAAHPLAYLAVWMVLGIAMAANLYDAAFATLGRIFGAGARRPITALTLIAGFASTVSWPTTHILLDACRLARQLSHLCRAARLYCRAAARFGAAAPALHGAGEAGGRCGGGARCAAALRPAVHSGGVGIRDLRLRAVRTVGASPGDLRALRHRRRNGGVDRRAVRAGAGRRARSSNSLSAATCIRLWVARFALAMLLCAFAMLALLGMSVPVATVFALMFGGANGLITITRGAVPLALFGASGYGRLMGRLAGPSLLVQAAAPLVMAFVVDRASDAASLALAACFVAVALVCFVVIRRPA